MCVVDISAVCACTCSIAGINTYLTGLVNGPNNIALLHSKTLDNEQFLISVYMRQQVNRSEYAKK